ncbi:serine/threonine-protein kinase [Streptomyces sp. 35M1]|uniref:serine/threonine-protein kinase n=1 Tax=Streptomyces sp. 35M1 TaxID=3142978 RepID=UPI0039907656
MTEDALARQLTDSATIEACLKEQFLLEPTFWLAPAVLAVAAELTGDSRKAARARSHALTLGQDKATLFFALISSRRKMQAEAAYWMDAYLGGLDASHLGEEFRVVLEAVACAELGYDALSYARQAMNRWDRERNARIYARHQGGNVADLIRWEPWVVRRTEAATTGFDALRRLSGDGWQRLEEGWETASAVQATTEFLRESYSEQPTADTGNHRSDTALRHLIGQLDPDESEVQEQIEGRALTHFMGEGTPATLAQTARWGAQVCEGLADAHEVDVVHRDVKPANIMISERSDVKLVDFGLARLIDNTVTHGTGLTWLYASPERCKGRPGDHRTDLYSLGCVLYEMLTGRPPFGGPETALPAIANMHLHVVPAAPQDVRPGVPGGLGDLVLHLLAKNPDDRPKDARSVARLIHQVEHVPEAPPSGTVVLSVDPHVNPDYMERIRELESTIDRLRSTHRATDPVVLDARMQLAEITGESGDTRGAITLYRTLAEECRADLGPYDTRTLDAFEAMARWIAGSGR